MKSNFKKKQNKLVRRVACFTFLQISLMSGSTESNCIFITAFHSVCCDVPSQTVFGKLTLTLLKVFWGSAGLSGPYFENCCSVDIIKGN